MRVNHVAKASKLVLKDGKPRFRCMICGHEVMPGEAYKWAKGRYDYARKIACQDHNFRQSMLTGSKLSEVYSAREALEDAISADDPEAMLTEAQNLSEVMEQVASEYEEAAEAFGGAGENADRADDLRNYVSDVEDATSTLETAKDEWAEAQEAADTIEAEEDEDTDELEDHGDPEELLQAVRDAAQEVVDACAV